MFDLNAFIGTYVTGRKESMFRGDLKKHHDALTAGIRGKRVCVIGGAGSIGSSFIRALLPYEPAELVIVDTNENALTELTRDLRSSGGYMPPSYLSYPMDYASAAFRHMFTARGGFHIVANFSAHKHVRSEKDIYSVEALFTNNVLHAVGLLELLEQYPPEKYFCAPIYPSFFTVKVMLLIKLPAIVKSIVTVCSSETPDLMRTEPYEGLSITANEPEFPDKDIVASSFGSEKYIVDPGAT